MPAHFTVLAEFSLAGQSQNGIKKGIKKGTCLKMYSQVFWMPFFNTTLTNCIGQTGNQVIACVLDKQTDC